MERKGRAGEGKTIDDCSCSAVHRTIVMLDPLAIDSIDKTRDWRHCTVCKNATVCNHPLWRTTPINPRWFPTPAQDKFFFFFSVLLFSFLCLCVWQINLRTGYYHTWRFAANTGILILWSMPLLCSWGKTSSSGYATYCTILLHPCDPSSHQPWFFLASIIHRYTYPCICWCIFFIVLEANGLEYDMSQIAESGD